MTRRAFVLVNGAARESALANICGDAAHSYDTETGLQVLGFARAA